MKWLDRADAPSRQVDPVRARQRRRTWTASRRAGSAPRRGGRRTTSCARAIDLVQAGEADGIVTCPLHKEGLHAAGLRYPGHTEILAERTGTQRIRHDAVRSRPAGAARPRRGPRHLAHGAARRVSPPHRRRRCWRRFGLLDGVMRQLLRRAAAAGRGGPESARQRRRPVRRRRANHHRAGRAPGGRKPASPVTGPWPSDTLFVRAQRGEFDGIVAMYHDQGHIALKLLRGLARGQHHARPADRAHQRRPRHRLRHCRTKSRGRQLAGGSGPRGGAAQQKREAAKRAMNARWSGLESSARSASRFVFAVYQKTTFSAVARRRRGHG